MTRLHGIFGGAATELYKLAAADTKTNKKNDAAAMMPPSPLEMENEHLTDQLTNIQLKMQLRQAMQAQQAVAMQDQQQEQEQQQQQEQQQALMQNNPSIAASAPPALPTSPTDMIGAQ